MTYAEDDLWEEMSFLGYHMHWDLNTLLNLEHRDRGKLLENVAALNKRAWEGVRNAV